MCEKDKNGEFYYYTVKDKYNKPRITVALLYIDHNFARGIAFCSKNDKINKELGKIKAKGRAIKAATNEKNCLPINRNETIRMLFETNTSPFKFKSEYNAHLTKYEQELVGNAQLTKYEQH